MENLATVLGNHRKWVAGDGGERANLWGANLWGANLRSANLRSANLSGAYLRSANLRSADLSGADLSGADLSGANLWGANLRSANLRSANLPGANLRSATGDGKTVLSTSLKWAVVMYGNDLYIGCQKHSIDEWQAFTDEQISKMATGAVEWWNDHKELILTIAKRHAACSGS